MYIHRNYICITQNYYMKYVTLLSVLFSVIVQAQKIQVVDAEKGKPLPNARIILKDQIVYTNDDGFAPIENSEQNFEISAVGFTKVKVAGFKPVVKLTARRGEIQEVKIIKVNIKNIFGDVLKNYKKRYYSKPSLYDVTIKQKNFDNNQFHLMVVSEAKLWSKSNMYNKNLHGELQLQLNNVKYLNINTSDNIFLAKTNDFTHQYTDDIFLNFELARILKHLKNKNTKYSAIYSGVEDGEQLVAFRIKSNTGSIIKGSFKYNKNDKVISYYQVNYLMDDIPLQKKVSKDGREFDYKYGNATITFDFYKKDNAYLPSLARFESDRYTMFYKDKTHVKRSIREVVYNTFSESENKGLDPRVDFSKNIWENIPVRAEKDMTILLSTEEQEFINKK